MTDKHRVTLYGRRHIHNYVRTLADWQAKRRPGHTISEEYDRIIQAGIKTLYNHDIALELPEKPVEAGTPPAPAVANHG